MMTLERAIDIVTAVNGRAFVTMDLPGDLSPLVDVSLADMLRAKAMVEQANVDARLAAEQEGGGYVIRVVPDDRLIAAVYALDHYPNSREAVLAVPVEGREGYVKALAVQVVEVRQ